MKTVNSLPALLVLQLNELYNAEIQQQKNFSNLAKEVANIEFSKLIDGQRIQINKKIERLEKAFDMLSEPVKSKECDVMDELLDRVEEFSEKIPVGDVRDAGIIMSIQCINHFKMAAYGTLSAFAKTMGEEKIAALLHETVEEERNNDRELTTLAIKTINNSAYNQTLHSL